MNSLCKNQDLPNIFLVGPMGAGKTTIGHYLAELLFRRFFDSDVEIETRTGVSIPWIFEKEGEAGFRQREQSMIRELVQFKRIVLATGGGVVTQAENRVQLKQHGIVVYLYTPVELQWLRTQHDPHRPLLQVHDPKKKLQDLLTVRDPFYRETAHIIIETNQGAPRDLALLILQRIEQYATSMATDIIHHE